MSNKDVLTESAFTAFAPPAIMLEHIERSRSSFGLAKHDFRILDWGCGRGVFVLWLREHGYDAVGVDIDRTPFHNAADLFAARGYRLNDCLHSQKPGGSAPFPNASFHFVISYQVVEHIEDLNAAAAEWARLTVAGGGGFHVFPPHRRFVEVHLFMPFVHWLPKNAARKWLIGLFVLGGIEPHWSQTQTWKEKQRMYYNFSVRETFYRSPAAIRDVLAAQGFETEFLKLAGSRRSWTRVWWMNVGGDLGLAVSRPPRR